MISRRSRCSRHHRNRTQQSWSNRTSVAAARHDDASAVDTLLALASNDVAEYVNARDNECRAALDDAASGGHQFIVDRLPAEVAGFEDRVKDTDGRTNEDLVA